MSSLVPEPEPEPVPEPEPEPVPGSCLLRITSTSGAEGLAAVDRIRVTDVDDAPQIEPPRVQGIRVIAKLVKLAKEKPGTGSGTGSGTRRWRHQSPALSPIRSLEPFFF